MLEDLGIGMRAERGFLEFNPGITDLGAICTEIIDLFEEDLSDKHTLRFIHTGQLHDLWLDGALMNHVVTNLVSNALKYSPDGGEVILNVSRSETEIIITVSDQGIGIPREDLTYLFVSFFRAGNVGGIRGTGLGLAIIKSVVELHGGTITCASIVDSGSTFRISIPIQISNVLIR
jgi:signal transduction histidine kinase